MSLRGLLDEQKGHDDSSALLDYAGGAYRLAMPL